MKSLADMMGAVLKETGSAGAMAPIWARVVGEVVAKHARPVRWEGQALVIRCDGEAWRQALEPERASISRKLAAAMGEPVTPSGVEGGLRHRSGRTEPVSILLEVSQS